ncbi:GNAT family N-acetyltransferase [Nocardiopsis sp. HUAS JQ3]|uniref:GNAT family N-acetyltransferase n=1 Tax=Nocardiopsis sp. HUAS JQ3 TaxID=3061629 RepID=UPI0023A94CF2|nr:GNAT family N-acetyltransferase [Nocardiopsis sp. HUAS JQ3]WDZ88382.1 GNAT family N-acetyltransferase [Nocardiopsis sp. HUAS JQ3]
MGDRTASIESMQQLTRVWRSLVLDRDPRADVRDLPGLAVRWADCRFAFWNCLTLTGPDLDAAGLERDLHRAARVMRTKRHPGFLWLFADLLDQGAREHLHETAHRAGLERAFGGVGMAADLAHLPEPSHPDLTFVRVSNDAHLGSYADLNSRAYGFALEEGRDGLAGSTLWKDGVHAYLGMRRGEAVTCAATVPARDCLFVVLVATAPHWQRRGYAEAVTRKALYEGARASGLGRAVLQATEAGAPVYPRIGFTPNSPLHFYRLRG